MELCPVADMQLIYFIVVCRLLSSLCRELSMVYLRRWSSHLSSLLVFSLILLACDGLRYLVVVTERIKSALRRCGQSPRGQRAVGSVGERSLVFALFVPVRLQQLANGRRAASFKYFHCITVNRGTSRLPWAKTDLWNILMTRVRVSNLATALLYPIELSVVCVCTRYDMKIRMPRLCVGAARCSADHTVLSLHGAVSSCPYISSCAAGLANESLHDDIRLRTYVICLYTCTYTCTCTSIS